MIDIETFKLSAGSHKSIEEGACLLELASHMAGEKFSDRPECVCPVLAESGRGINDRMDDESRQKLKAYLPRILNTKDDKTPQRANILAHAALTVFAPLALDAAYAAANAAADAADAADAANAAYAAANAAYAAARSKVWDAVREVFEQATGV